MISATAATAAVGALCLPCEPRAHAYTQLSISLNSSASYGEVSRKKLGTQGASSGKSLAICSGCGSRMICLQHRSHLFIVTWA